MTVTKFLCRVVPCFAFLLCLVAGDATGAERPNVVLFLVDDMGWMDSSVYGSKYYRTPNMERFAEQSMRFTDAYALPLCSPTRASILTGQYSSRHGVTSASGHQPPRPADFSYLPERAPPHQPLRMPVSKNYLDPAHHTLAEALREEGYRTGHFGKWHLGVEERHWPERHGFDVAWHCQPSPGPPGAYFSPYGVLPPGTPRSKAKGQKYVVGTITDGPDGEYITDRVTDEALAFIESSRGRPFFLNLWHFGVHGPWGHKEAYTAGFAKTTDPTGRQGNPIMASMLRSIDESLGRVVEKLDELGIADNTLFIFYSDNGGNVHSNVPGSAKTTRAEKSKSEMLRDWRRWAGNQPPTNNAPLREGKGRIYEGGTRVPLMVRWPGRIPSHSTSDAIVGPIDLYPTILDAIGIQPLADQVIDGESLLPVLERQGELQRNAYFTWFPHLIPAVSVRQDDWKLIRRFQPHRDYPDVRELYDLTKDLGETNNLAAAMSDKVKQLDQLIDQFVAETGALYPQPNPAYDPKRASASTVSRNPLSGLVPKFCKATLIEGAVRIEGDARSPFLGTAQVRIAGPLTLRIRMRSPQGGSAMIRWKLPDQDAFPEAGQSIDYTLPPGDDWEEVKVEVPIQGKAAIIRIYLPATRAPVEIEAIEFIGKGGSTKRWTFASS